MSTVPAIPAHLQCFHKHFTCLLVHVLRAPIAEIDWISDSLREANSSSKNWVAMRPNWEITEELKEEGIPYTYKNK